MVSLKNPAEAAIKAGYAPEEAENVSARLLGGAGIRGEIENLTENEKKRETRQDAIGGLKRIAFGAVNGAVRLLIKEDSIADGELAALDLFNVSEIKRQKGGGLEIKFFDRLKALELLLEWDGESANPSGGSIYDAILNSASIYTPAESDDSDAV